MVGGTVNIHVQAANVVFSTWWPVEHSMAQRIGVCSQPQAAESGAAITMMV